MPLPSFGSGRSCRRPQPEVCPAPAFVGGRQRDIFPLPFQPAHLPSVGESATPFAKLSSRVRQRVSAKAQCGDMVNACIGALNLLDDGAGKTVPMVGKRLTAAQESVVQHVRKRVLEFGAPPVDMTPEGALTELRGSLDYGGDPTPPNLAHLDLQLLSLPPPGHVPIDSEVARWGPADFNVEEFYSGLVLPQVQARERLCDAPARPFLDPKLRCRSVYVSFLKKLQQSALIDFGLDHVEMVGAFCVWKKSGSARRSN